MRGHSELTEAEYKAGKALAEANRLLEERNTEERRYLVEICRNALIKASYDAMHRGVA
jgi:hypothetical protein